MSNIYVLTKEELDLTIERVINRLKKTDTINPVNNTNPEDDKLTQKEASELLGVTVQCIIKWKKKKLIPYYQIGRSVFFSKKELLAQARKNPALIKPVRK